MYTSNSLKEFVNILFNFDSSYILLNLVLLCVGKVYGLTNTILSTVNQRFLLHFFTRVWLDDRRLFNPYSGVATDRTYIISQWKSICQRGIFCTLFPLFVVRKNHILGYLLCPHTSCLERDFHILHFRC